METDEEWLRLIETLWDWLGMIETNGDVKTNEVLVFFENKRIGLKALTNLL